MSQIGFANTGGGGSGGVLQLSGNIGVAVPVGGNINVITSNGSPVTIGSGDTLTLNFAGAPGETSLIVGTDPASLGSHNLSVLLGLLMSNNGDANTAVGSFSNIVGTHNTLMSQNGISNGDDNTLVGYNISSPNGSNNTVVGSGSRANHDNNVCIGKGTKVFNGFGPNQGSNVLLGTGIEVNGSNNILIDCGIQSFIDDTIIIGDGTQLSCSISGIYNTTPNVGYQIVVADSTNKISTVATGGLGFVLSISGNVGTADPDITGDIAIVTANSTPIFDASVSTVTLDFALTTNLALGSSLPVLAGGIQNTSFGVLAMQGITSGNFNTVVGYSAGGSITSEMQNVCIGQNSDIIGSDGNIIIGASATHNAAPGPSVVIGFGATNTASTSIVIGAGSSANNTTNVAIGSPAYATGNSSMAIGSNSTASGQSSITIGNTCTAAGLESIVIGAGSTDGGFGNIVIGGGAGTSLTGAGNIVIDSLGLAGTNNISIGSAQTTCNIAGIYNTTPAAGYLNVVVDSANKLSTIVGITPYAYTNVNTTPYVVLVTDVYLGVDSSGGAIQINLPNAPVVGRVIVIKDRTGSAAINAITVTTVGGVVLIDGAITFVMNTNYQSIQVLFDGTTYQIF